MERKRDGYRLDSNGNHLPLKKKRKVPGIRVMFTPKMASFINTYFPIYGKQKQTYQKYADLTYKSVGRVVPTDRHAEYQNYRRYSTSNRLLAHKKCNLADMSPEWQEYLISLMVKEQKKFVSVTVKGKTYIAKLDSLNRVVYPQNANRNEQRNANRNANRNSNNHHMINDNEALNGINLNDSSDIEIINDNVGLYNNNGDIINNVNEGFNLMNSIDNDISNNVNNQKLFDVGEYERNSLLKLNEKYEKELQEMKNKVKDGKIFNIKEDFKIFNDSIMDIGNMNSLYLLSIFGNSKIVNEEIWELHLVKNVDKINMPLCMLLNLISKAKENETEWKKYMGRWKLRFCIQNMNFKVFLKDLLYFLKNFSDLSEESIMEYINGTVSIKKCIVCNNLSSVECKCGHFDHGLCELHSKEGHKCALYQSMNDGYNGLNGVVNIDNGINVNQDIDAEWDIIDELEEKQEMLNDDDLDSMNMN